MSTYLNSTRARGIRRVGTEVFSLAPLLRPGDEKAYGERLDKGDGRVDEGLVVHLLQFSHLLKLRLDNFRACAGRLELLDEIGGVFNPQTVSLGVGPSSIGKESHFSVGNPVYNLGLTLTPGLNPKVWVDITVWSNQWNWPIWFPQLGIDLPPHGADFGYHAGTTCVVDFAEVYNASTGQVNDLAKEADVAHRTLTGRVV